MTKTSELSDSFFDSADEFFDEPKKEGESFTDTPADVDTGAEFITKMAARGFTKVQALRIFERQYDHTWPPDITVLDDVRYCVLGWGISYANWVMDEALECIQSNRSNRAMDYLMEAQMLPCMKVASESSGETQPLARLRTIIMHFHLLSTEGPRR